MKELRNKNMGQWGIPEVTNNRKLLSVLVLEEEKESLEDKAIKLDLETRWGLSSGRWANKGRVCLSRARITGEKQPLLFSLAEIPPGVVQDEKS